MTLLNKEEERELMQKAKNGDIQAKNELIMKNQGLVRNIAKKFKDKGLDMEELVQEGNIGLIKAIQKFDLSTDYKLSTYATFWIRQNIQKAIIETGRTIKIPSHIQEQITKMKKTAVTLEQELERIPTQKEIADRMGLTVQTVEQLYQTNSQVVSYDEPISNDGEDSLLELQIGDDGTQLIETVYQKEMRKKIEKSMEKLTEKQKKVIIERYINNRTLESIGDELGVTRERIRQIEKNALKKMKSAIQ